MRIISLVHMCVHSIIFLFGFNPFLQVYVYQLCTNAQFDTCFAYEYAILCLLCLDHYLLQVYCFGCIWTRTSHMLWCLSAFLTGLLLLLGCTLRIYYPFGIFYTILLHSLTAFLDIMRSRVLQLSFAMRSRNRDAWWGFHSWSMFRNPSGLFKDPFRALLFANCVSFV